MDEHVGKDGLPIHLPMPVNRMGQGPVDFDSPDIHHWVCWCGQDCSWNKAFTDGYRRAYNEGSKDGFRQGFTDY